jgi:hypothetical protein
MPRTTLADLGFCSIPKQNENAGDVPQSTIYVPGARRNPLRYCMGEYSAVDAGAALFHVVCVGCG